MESTILKERYPRWPERLYPYKPIRYLSKLEEPLTTIIAVRCSNGIVLASDTQLTGSVKEFGAKIISLGDHSLLACSGFSDYIELFKRNVRDTIDDNEHSSNPEPDYMKLLDKSRLSYLQEIDVERKYIPQDFMDEIGLKPSHFYPDAIFVTIESSTKRIIGMKNPFPYTEVLHPMNRATAGTGGDIAQIFLRTIEHAMSSAGLGFDKLPIKLVSQFCYIMLGRIAFIDPQSSGVSISAIMQEQNDSHVIVRELDEWEIFPQNEDARKSHFAKFLETSMETISKEAIKKFLDYYKVSLDDILARMDHS